MMMIFTIIMSISWARRVQFNDADPVPETSPIPSELVRVNLDNLKQFKSIVNKLNEFSSAPFKFHTLGSILSEYEKIPSPSYDSLPGFRYYFLVTKIATKHLFLHLPPRAIHRARTFIRLAIQEILENCENRNIRNKFKNTKIIKIKRILLNILTECFLDSRNCNEYY